MSLAKLEELDVVEDVRNSDTTLGGVWLERPVTAGKRAVLFFGRRGYGVRRISLSESKRIRVVLIAA